MGYSKARLEHALMVFRQRKGPKDTRPDHYQNRELRMTTRRLRTSAFQTWNFSGALSDSDEDEYDPVEDRRRLKAPRRKKKDEVARRKLSDTANEERTAKRARSDDLPHQIDDAGYLVLRLTSRESRDRLEELLRGQVSNLQDSGPSANRSTTSLGASFAEPIAIDSSDEEPADERFGAPLQMTIPGTRASAGRLNPNHDRSEVERFDTSYAHPINFKLFPGKDEASQCHFCSDWTMAVVGHGTRYITAIRNSVKPTEYHEIANGHRAEGKSPTQMCVRCALDRLLIMRCHSPLDISITTPAHQFTRIRSQQITEPQSYAYLRHLFCRMNQQPERISPKYHLPACNLCPQLASWICCKWQERDHARRPCLVPKVDPKVQARVDSARVDSAITDPSSSVSSPLVINLLDSSDEEDEVSTPINPNLRPPLRGCGLHLCNSCYTFVTQSCKGLLPKKRILAYLDSTRYKRRADVEWLFKESLLEEAYEGGRR